MSTNPFAALTRQQKATITLIDKTGNNKGSITFQYNPETLKITRKVDFKSNDTTSQNGPSLEFKGVKPATMSLKILFDTSMETSGSPDVRLKFKKLIESYKVDTSSSSRTTKRGEPNRILFSWGSGESFFGFTDTIDVDYKLFNREGVPIRADVSFTLTEVTDASSYPRQNPTSGSLPGYSLHTVVEGDRLDLLAHKYYDKPMMWRYLAEKNDLDSPRDIRPGMRLLIPPLP